MAPQPTTVITRSALLRGDSWELRNPLPATSCACRRKIPHRCGVPFTESAPSATINHNNMDTRNVHALILGIPRGGLSLGSC
jgi:hypothetical protein